MTILERIKDPSLWAKVVRRVPIFATHEMWELPNGAHVAYAVDEPNKVGRFLYRVDEKVLRETLERMEREIEETGNLPIMTIGHRGAPSVTPQEKQPPVVGVFANPEMGRWGPKKKIGILADAFYEDGPYYAKAGKMPHRSPEFYPKSRELTSVALLNTDPKLALGLVTAYARPDGCFCYERGFPMAEDMAQEDPTQVSGGDDKPDEVFHRHFNKSCDHEFPRLREMHAKHMEQYGGAAPGGAAMPGSPAGVPAMPGPTSGAMPPMPPKPMPGGVEAMARDGVPESYAKAFEELRTAANGAVAELAQLKAERKVEREQYARSTVEGALQGLVDSYRQNGPVKALLDEKVYKKELEYELALYARDPKEWEQRYTEIDTLWEHVPPDPTSFPLIPGVSSISYGRTADSQLPAQEMTMAEQYARAEAATKYLFAHPEIANKGEGAWEIALEKVDEAKKRKPA